MREPRIRIAAIAILALLAIVHVGRTGYYFYTNAVWWSDVGIDEPHVNVLYGVGAPLRERASDGAPWRPAGKRPDMNARAWGYLNPAGGSVIIEFDPATGRSARVTCFHPEGLPGACPPLYRIRLGMYEDRVYRLLGTPSWERLSGDTKVMRYEDLGAEFALKRYTVYRMTTLRERGSFFARWTTLFRQLLP